MPFSTIRILFAVLLMVCLAVTAAQSKNQQKLIARVTFQDGTVIDVSEPEFVYQWILASDSRYINPPVTEIRTTSFWLQETNHGVISQRKVSPGEIEVLEIQFGSLGDSCSLKGSVVVRNGMRFDEPAVNALPQNVEKDVIDPTFHSIALIGTANGAKARNKFSIKLWGAGICPEAKEVVAKVKFLSGL